jgi:hypothetical protein
MKATKPKSKSAQKKLGLNVITGFISIRQSILTLLLETGQTQ